LVYDGKENIIPKSIQLIAGRLGREYNQRKNRKVFNLKAVILIQKIYRVIKYAN